MTAARRLSAAVARLSRRLPEERRQWVEAVLAEAGSVPGRWRRAAWVAGAVRVLLVEVAMIASRSAWTVRLVVVGAVAAVLGLLVPVFAHYPQVGQGSGAPLYAGLTAVLLAAYVVATFRLTRTAPMAARDGLLAGVVAALVWTLGLPAGGLYHVQGPLALLYGLGLAAAFAGPAIVAISAPATGQTSSSPTYTTRSSPTLAPSMSAAA